MVEVAWIWTCTIVLGIQSCIGGQFSSRVGVIGKIKTSLDKRMGFLWAETLGVWRLMEKKVEKGQLSTNWEKHLNANLRSRDFIWF